LLPNYLISKLFNKKLVYDSHELFTEVPELINRPIVKIIWLQIEKLIVPKLKNMYTVNEAIANIYHNKYSTKVHVIKNIAPSFKDEVLDKNFKKKIKGDHKMLILQGTGINKDRGAEEAIEMMQYLNNTILYIIGSGDIFKSLIEKVKGLKLQEKVFIIGKMPYENLIQYTRIADLGLSLDKNTNLNYEYSLPNKVFDYVQAKTPLLVSNRKLVAEFVSENTIGKVVTTHNPKLLAKIISEIFEDKEQYALWKRNLINVASIYNWENESEKLKSIYSNLK